MSALSKRLVLAKRRIITSLAFIVAKDNSDRCLATDNFLEGCIWFSLRELNSPSGKNNDDEKLPVVGNTPVINNYVVWVPKLLLKDWFRLECILSALRGVHLMDALGKVFEIKLSAKKDRYNLKKFKISLCGRWLHTLFFRKFSVNNCVSDEGLTLETSAFLPFTVANLRFQPSC